MREPTANETFAEFVTDTAFNLSLSKRMVASLLMFPLEKLTPRQRFDAGRWMQSWQSLELRGLIYWKRDANGNAYKGPFITDPGKLV